jgi:RNA polymerase sigma-70 factor (ECF subfamily)
MMDEATQPSETTGAATPDSQVTRSDGSLVYYYRQGDEAAATELFLRYAARLQGLARGKLSDQIRGRVDADEIVQSVFRRFFQSLRDGTCAVPRGADLWSLLFTIGLNRIRAEENFHRAQVRDVRRTESATTPAQTDELVRELEDWKPGPFVQVLVDDLLAQLPEQHRKVVQLRIENFEVSRIAEMLGRSKRSTERMLAEAREYLQSILDEEDKAPRST